MDKATLMLDCLAAQQLVQRTAKLLDDEDLNGWLALFDSQGSYEISAYSPELRQPQVWWQSDLTALGKTLAEVPRHVRDPARRRRVVGAGTFNVDNDVVRMESAFSIHRTTPEGESSLYAVGRYEDVLVRSPGGEWRYRLHRVLLDTRVLDAFTHLPL